MNGSKLTLGYSPLTKKIYCGKPLKSGIWGKVKVDVTKEAVACVAQHLKESDIYHEYEIKGEKFELRMTKVSN